MPLLYGEGDHAFKRLQVEILNRYGDESVLTWRYAYDIVSSRMGLEILATHPHRFTGASNIVLASIHNRPPPVFVSNFIEVRMGTGRRGVFHHQQEQDIYVVRLNCVLMSDEGPAFPSVIFIRSAGCKQNHFVRTMPGDGCIYRESDEANGNHWQPIKTNETIFVHLDALAVVRRKPRQSRGPEDLVSALGEHISVESKVIDWPDVCGLVIRRQDNYAREIDRSWFEME